MSLTSTSPGWHRHAVVPLAAASGIAFATVSGAPGICLGLALSAAALSALLADRLRHHVQAQARFCEHWPFVVAPLGAGPAPPGDMPSSAFGPDVDRRRRGVATQAAALRLALAGGEEPAELELQLRALMDGLSQHMRRETDLLARRADARRRAHVDAARLQLANAEYDFHRYCIGDLTLAELVDRVTAALVADRSAWA
ncbi:MAG TPA: hypothetical protein VIP05_24145, partial [Burkholderiaceae bacterium]